MNALADKAHKQGMPHSDMHSIYNTATLFNNASLPYSSSKFSPNCGATATYVGMVVE